MTEQGVVDVRHWGLPDPAAVEGSEELTMAAFRDVRDELHKRLELLLGSA